MPVSREEIAALFAAPEVDADTDVAVPGTVPVAVPYLFMARWRCSVIRWLYRIVMATVLWPRIA